MQDNDLIKLFLPIIQAGIATDFPGVTIKQANQPTQQGINTGPTLYFFKVGDRRYGFRETSDVWDALNTIEVHTETQPYETTFQISALVIQDVNNTNTYTASDLLNYVSYIMQSAATITALRVENVGVLRVTEVSNPYFTDDRDQFEAAPSFSFVLTHLQTIISESEVIESVDEIIISI